MKRKAIEFGVWILLCAIASYAVMGFDFRPGLLGPALTAWPTETSLVRDPAGTTVLAFLHPRCPCTRATVQQLIKTIHSQGQAKLTAVFYMPANAKGAKEWEQGDYVQKIRAALPNAHILFDTDGQEAAKFGAMTSGTILAYDGKGREIFRGGITDKRGGERDNPGVRRFGNKLATGQFRAEEEPTPVFGCPLIAPKKG